MEIGFQYLIFVQLALQDDRIISFFYFSVDGSFVHLVSEIEISGQLLSYRAGSADLAAAKDGIFYGAEYSYYVKAAVSPEGLVLQSDKSVLNVFRDLIYLNDSPVLIAVSCIYYVLFVIVQNGTLR